MLQLKGLALPLTVGEWERVTVASQRLDGVDCEARCEPLHESPHLPPWNKQRWTCGICAGAVKCNLSCGIIQWDATQAARATDQYYVRLKTGGDLNECIRYQAYRLLTLLKRVREDDRSGEGRRVLLNACLSRSIVAHHPSESHFVAGFKRQQEDGLDAAARCTGATSKKARNR